jgi:hypothetical protein
MHLALDLGAIDNTRRRLADALSEVDSSNHYRFTLNSATTVTAAMSGLSGDAQLLLIRDAGGDGQVNAGDLLAASTNAGTAPEQLTMSLAAGTYDVWVTPVNRAQTPYALSLQAGTVAVTPVPVPPPPPAAPPVPPPPAPAGATISGFVWRDHNGNGTRDPGDAGLPGWRVYADLNNSGRYDAATDRVATTDLAGYYGLTKLPNRAYVVRSLGLAGHRQTTAAGSYTVTVSRPAEVFTQRNFGYTNRALATGSVWLDANRSKVRDRGEVGLGGWQVLLDRNNNGPGRRRRAVRLDRRGWELRVPRRAVRHVRVAGGRQARLRRHDDERVRPDIGIRPNGGGEDVRVPEVVTPGFPPLPPGEVVRAQPGRVRANVG